MSQPGASSHPSPHPSMGAHPLAAFAVNGITAPSGLPPHSVPSFPSSLPSASATAAAAANANLLSAGLLPSHPLAPHMFGVRGGVPISAPSAVLPAAVGKEELRRSSDRSSGNCLIWLSEACYQKSELLYVKKNY